MLLVRVCWLYCFVFHVMDAAMAQRGNGMPVKPNVKELITRPTGELGMEMFHSGFDNPVLMNESRYIRLHADVKLGIAGIPLGVNGYYTTEQQTLFNNNSLNLYFDKDAYMRRLEQEKREKLGAVTKQVNANKDQLRNSRKQLSDLTNRIEMVETQRAERLRSLAALTNPPLTNPIDARIRDSLNEHGSLHAEMHRNSIKSRSAASDSVLLQRLTADTQRLYRYQQNLQLQVSNITSKVAHWDSLVRNDSLMHVGSNYNMSELSNKSKSLPVPKLTGIMTNISTLQVGLFNTSMNPLGLNGTAIRGLNLGYGVGKMDVEVAIGRMQSTDFSSFDRRNNRFNRNIAATKLGYQFASVTVNLFAHRIYDDQTKLQQQEERQTAYSNNLIGLNVAGNWGARTTLNISVAHCEFQARPTTTVGVENITAPTADNFLNTKAYNAGVQYRITRNIQGFLNTLNSGNSFRNLGNPFMRYGYEENQTGISAMLLRKRLHISSFIKSWKDNPTLEGNRSNHGLGYGLNAGTRFKNPQLPNLQFMISPFEQGNNHPDTLMRIHSRSELTSASIYWNPGRKAWKYSSNINASQSRIHLWDTLSSVFRTYAINQDIRYKERYFMGAGITYIRNYPGIDSAQGQFCNFKLGWNFTKTNSMSILANQFRYLNGAFRSNASLQISAQIHRTKRLTCRIGYDQISGIWGFESMKSFQGMLRFDWLLK